MGGEGDTLTISRGLGFTFARASLLLLLLNSCQ